MLNRRICILGTSPNSKGGIGTVVKGFNESVRPQGYTFDHIVTHADCGKLKKVCLATGAYTKCLMNLRKANYELVHMHTAFGASFTRSVPFIKLASKRSIPIVNHIHSDDWTAFYECASLEKRKLVAEAYRSCDRVVALSDEWRDILATILPSSKIVVLENFTPVYEPDFTPNYSNKVVVFMSRLERIKGCELLPKICESVISQVPDATFLICGEGSMGELLRKELSARSLDRSVKMMGWVDSDKKIDLLKMGALFLLPSYGEGMPMCILEAMGVGLPVVATKVGGVPRLVENGVNGYLFNPGDSDSIASSIIELLNNPVKMDRMGKEAKSRARSRSFGPYSERLKAIYDDLLRGSH